MLTNFTSLTTYLGSAEKTPTCLSTWNRGVKAYTWRKHRAEKTPKSCQTIDKMLKKIEKVENVKKVEKILKGRTNYSFVVGRGMCYTGLRDLLRDYRILDYIITGFPSSSGLFQPNLKTDCPP